jgi:hypothetical protein
VEAARTSGRCSTVSLPIASASRARGVALLGFLALLGAPAVAHAATSSAASAPKPTKLALVSSLDPSLSGATVSFTATVSPAVNGGTLSFTVNGDAVPGCTSVPMSGLSGVDCAVTFETAATYTVAASYSGDGRFAASSAFLVQTVVAPATGPQTASVAGPVGVVIEDTPSQTDHAPTIAYSETGAVASATCTIDGGSIPCGSASTTVAALSSGHHTFEITVSGGGSTATAEASWIVVTSAAAKPGSKSHAKDPAKRTPKKQGAP